MAKTITIVGMEKLEKKLKKNTDLTAVKTVVKKNGSEMQTKAQKHAPVDTGALKESISLNITDAGMTAEVEPKKHYGVYVELGTRFMKEQPYLKPAFDEQKGKFKQDMDKLVR